MTRKYVSTSTPRTSHGNEAAGYVIRERDTEDRRRVFVSPTPAVQRAAGELYGPLLEEGFKLAGRCTTKELESFLDFLRRGREMNERHLARLRERQS